jgi:hypothetical protein
MREHHHRDRDSAPTVKRRQSSLGHSLS